MASENFNHEETDKYWTIWPIAFATLLSVYCLIVMGLKLRWFRAQLRLGETNSRTTETTVTGIGFKTKRNSQEFHTYKQVSEFSPNSINNQNKTSYQQNNIKKPVSRTDSLKIIKTELNTKNSSNNINHLITTAVKDETVGQKIKPSYHVESEMITANNKPRFEKKSSEIEKTNINKVPQFKNPNAIAAKKPLPVQQPLVEEENFKIEIVDETPKKPKNKYEEVEEDYNNSYFGKNNTMYSSQAASIFFRGTTPTPQPRISPRTFNQEDSDNESENSQTSA